MNSPKLKICGPNRLAGKVSLQGAKNSALKVLIAALLTDEPTVLKNIPAEINDVKITLKMLESIGVDWKRNGDTFLIKPTSIKKEVSSPSEGSIRTSLLFLGALLARKGEAIVPLPGGDKIGERKYNLHLMALRKLGAKVNLHKGIYLKATCKNLKGAVINFPFKTTGGTENVLLASVLAKGRTIIKNAYTRPEVYDLIRMLNKMGAKIKVVGGGYIEIEGVKKLKGTNYEIIYDNVEALTFLVAVLMTKSSIEIENFPFKDLEIPLITLKESGLRFQKKGRILSVDGERIMTGFEVITGTYPNINSDFQPLLCSLATQCLGPSKIIETQFRKRWQFVPELNKMGAKIKIRGDTALIEGPTKLKGSNVWANDIRGGAALINAALCAEGETVIENAREIDRGYEKIDEKLKSLGAKIKRI